MIGTVCLITMTACAFMLLSILMLQFPPDKSLDTAHKIM
jgi:hypothetical protein